VIWESLGRVHVVDGRRAWAQTHAFIPTPLMLADRIRVYFAALDEDRYGRIGWVDLDREDPRRVVAEAEEPVLDLGPLGAFDDSGVNPSCVLQQSGRILLYYIGWQRTGRVPYMLFSGLATAPSAAGPFERSLATPVLDRIASEPFSRSAPFVLRENAGFRAWYWSCTHWTAADGGARYNNVIKHAKSADGVIWTADVTPCISPTGGDYSFGRPWVLREEGLYRMWLSVRSESRTHGYRIAYAESEDGLSWTQPTTVDIARRSDWDSDMTCMSAVVDVDDRRLMLYNGNGYGATGFGVAELVR
jgi:hypothetical protein